MFHVQSSSDMLPDLGYDRTIALAADVNAKIEQRRLKNMQPVSMIQKYSSFDYTSDTGPHIQR